MSVRISSPSIFIKAVKLFYPIFCLSFVGMFIYDMTRPGTEIDSNAILFIIVFLSIFTAIVLYSSKIIWRYADSVFDEGESLLIQRGGIEHRIPFGEIVNVSNTRISPPESIEIDIRHEGPLGKKIVFLAPFKINPFSRSPVMSSIIEKADRARNT